jgi:hypothetical protein
LVPLGITSILLPVTVFLALETGPELITLFPAAPNSALRKRAETGTCKKTPILGSILTASYLDITGADERNIVAGAHVKFVGH